MIGLPARESAFYHSPRVLADPKLNFTPEIIRAFIFVDMAGPID